MGRRYDTISFLSDFGHADEFVGVVHSVIRSLAPHAAVIDVCHEIAAHDVRAGSLTLVRSVQYLAPGIVLAVVDPGVGTERRAVAVEVGDGEGIFVGPDNGLMAPAVAMAGGAGRAVELKEPGFQLQAPGGTFAGRDVFAPAAGHLCLGVDLADLGPAVDPETLQPGLLPLPRVEGGAIHAEVLWVDRFGNAQLNVGPDDLASVGIEPDGAGSGPTGGRVQLRWRDQMRTARLAGAYGEVGGGEVGLVVDSYGLLSLALTLGSAADELGLRPSDGVELSAPA